MNHIYNTNTGKKETIDTLLAGAKKHIWRTSLSNELGRLAHGVGNRVSYTNTISFIPRDQVPQDAKVTYANMVCDHRPLKPEPYRVRLTVGGDKLNYNDNAASLAASLLETKLLINSKILDTHKGARFMCADLKDFFLATPIKKPEFMRIHSKYFFNNIRKEYNIDNIVANDGYVYVPINKGMYGLKQAAILAYRQLVQFLTNYGYKPCTFTNTMWKHDTQQTLFCLCVDDFGIKYYSKDDANHLLAALRNHNKILEDWTGKITAELK